MTFVTLLFPGSESEMDDQFLKNVFASLRKAIQIDGERQGRKIWGKGDSTTLSCDLWIGMDTIFIAVHQQNVENHRWIYNRI